MTKVELNRDNINKCLCKTCPVQTDSKCSKEKIEIIGREIEGRR